MSFCGGCGGHCGCSGGDCACGPYCSEACERDTYAVFYPRRLNAAELASRARVFDAAAREALSFVRRTIFETQAALAWWHVRREEREASERPTCPRISLKEAV